MPPKPAPAWLADVCVMKAGVPEDLTTALTNRIALAIGKPSKRLGISIV